ncbi:hypothetical protein QJS66_14210 [Kocuria rhizophila]|nr:hypothetical protein QJS66_14210 [Kocuria rhizophila]
MDSAADALCGVEGGARTAGAPRRTGAAVVKKVRQVSGRHVRACARTTAAPCRTTTRPAVGAWRDYALQDAIADVVEALRGVDFTSWRTRTSTTPRRPHGAASRLM